MGNIVVLLSPIAFGGFKAIIRDKPKIPMRENCIKFNSKQQSQTSLKNLLPNSSEALKFDFILLFQSIIKNQNQKLSIRF